VAAGGLTPESVGDLVRALDPDVVDVSSGVESRIGVKDAERVRAFVRNARAAGRERGAAHGGRA
jgi:phosphoribosylanthranilate isomerase